MAAGGNGDPSEKGHSCKVDIIPGCQVWCKTKFEEIQGTVSAYDQGSGVIIISILTKASWKPSRVTLFEPMALRAVG